MNCNKTIRDHKDLITSREETRTGFINFALEKNRRSTPYIESAKAFKFYASKASVPDDLLNIPEIKECLLTAAGLSNKALNYFTDKDKTIAIKKLIENFLKPAGKNFVDEAVYRYLLIKGDSLGGKMRNIIGALAQQKLIRALLSCLSVLNIPYKWLGSDRKVWQKKPDDDYQIENSLKAISWKAKRKTKTLGFNMKIPAVDNNVDICLFSATADEFFDAQNNPEKTIMLGELKGGIDPAGADEHWKTGNTALSRIRKAFEKIGQSVQTSFVGAAIEEKMASEIFAQLKDGTLSAAANLTKDKQLMNFCDWMIFDAK